MRDVAWVDAMDPFNYNYEIYYERMITRPPRSPVLAPNYPNPTPFTEVDLSWGDLPDEAIYYIYRDSSFITNVSLLSPIATVTGTIYTDTNLVDGVYYYAIVACNSFGNSSLSNCENVTVIIEPKRQPIIIEKNADFSKYASAGNGSATTPWIIEDYRINAYGMEKCNIQITNTSAHFILRNNTVSNSVIGILLKNVTNGQLINNSARFNNVGFNLTDSSTNILINNTAFNNTHPSDSAFGFYLLNADNNSLYGNLAFNNDGKLNLGGVGIYLYYSDSNVLKNNQLHHNIGTGLVLQYSNSNNITCNEIYSNRGATGYSHTGIAWPDSTGTNNRIEENQIYDHLDSGIYLHHSGVFNTIYNNTIHHNYHGIDAVVSTATGWIISYNKFFENDEAGRLWMGGANFYKNEIWNNTNGLSFWGVGGSILTNNTAFNNTNWGFYTSSAESMQFYDNVALDNGFGFGIGWADNVIMSNNYAYNNTNYGFATTSRATSSQLNNNVASGNKIGFYLGGAEWVEVKYNTIINNWEGVHLLNAQNCTIKNNDLYNNSQHGIYLENANFSVISNNEIINTTEGFHLINAFNATIESNDINNTKLYGFYLENVFEAHLESNRIFNSSLYGIYLKNAIDNEILYNDILNCSHTGIFLSGANLSNIKYNEIYNCSQNGIYFEKCNDSTIEWNQIVDNGKCIEQVSGINNVIEHNFCFDGPLLYPITPNPSYDGWIHLDWADVPWATYYLVYRKFAIPFANVWDIILWGTLVANVTESEMDDNIIATLGVFFYVVIAGNASCWSMWSNNGWVNVTGYPVPAVPFLSSTGTPDYDGQVQLSWNIDANATLYYIYRNTSTIVDINGLLPIAVTAGSNYIDVVSINITYYYVVIAGNPDYNSSISNCVNITVILYPTPETPTLSKIIPSEDNDGTVELNWADCNYTIRYYVYRDTQKITDVSNLVPIAILEQSNYTDFLSGNGTYFYVVVASNPSYNGTFSNCQNVTVILYPTILTPILYPMVTTDYDGVITISWSYRADTINYYVYRESFPILNATVLVPIARVDAPQLNFTDTISENKTLFYAVVAGNPSHNSSVSNSRSVTVIIYPLPSSPNLFPINVSNNGIVSLNWSDSINTVRYYVYRDTSPIINVTGLTPIGVTTQSYYIDVLTSNGTYFYAIVAENPSHKSLVSNSVSVEVVIYPSPTEHSRFPWYILIIVAACAVISVLYVQKRRGGKTQIDLEQKFSKIQIQEIKERLRNVKSVQEKIQLLKENAIPLSAVSDLQDAKLMEYFEQYFASLPIQLIEFLQRLNAPLEDKLEIITEYKNLSGNLKQEFLEELNEKVEP
ncbi:MAG: NosD domain-containing protein [Candidatus Helarchaeota archaeon]